MDRGVDLRGKVAELEHERDLLRLEVERLRREAAEVDRDRDRERNRLEKDKLELDREKVRDGRRAARLEDAEKEIEKLQDEARALEVSERECWEKRRKRERGDDFPELVWGCDVLLCLVRRER